MHLEIIRTWILSVTVSAIVIAAAEALMPEGSVKKAGRLTGGLILVLGVMQPLVSMDYGDLYDMVNTLPVGAVTRQEADAAAYDPMKGIIEQELATYIVDKAAELGASCTAVVVCAQGEDHVPVPQRTTVSGPLTEAQKAALSGYVEAELGVGRENQIYWNEEVP